MIPIVFPIRQRPVPEKKHSTCAVAEEKREGANFVGSIIVQLFRASINALFSISEKRFYNERCKK